MTLMVIMSECKPLIGVGCCYIRWFAEQVDTECNLFTVAQV